MNYCHRCQSSYDRPGTCNCYAPTPAPAHQTIRPYVPDLNTTGTIQWTPGQCAICGKYGCRETHVTFTPSVTHATTRSPAGEAAWSTTTKRDVPFTLTT